MNSLNGLGRVTGGGRPNGNNGGRGRGSYNKYSRGGTGISASATTSGNNNRRKPGHGGVMKEYNQQHQREKDAEALELEKTAKLNSEVCGRMDKNFKKLIKVAAQVALYEYDCPTQTWKPCNTRGSLFLYKRVVEPYIGLFILNRNSLENFALMITPQIEMQVVKPYIMMRTTEAIRCFWFYSEEECVEIANLISKQVGISLQTQGQVVKKMEAPSIITKQGSGEGSNNVIKSQGVGDGRAGVVGGVGDFFVPGNEGRHILSLLCNKVSTSIQNVREDEGEEENGEVEAQDKISCQNLPGLPGPKGLTQQELDSLGAELRATLGIINDPRRMINEELLMTNPLMKLFADKSEEDEEDVTVNTTFLNMEQMLQATVYLLKTETGFAGKLEAAYMNSLSDHS